MLFWDIKYIWNKLKYVTSIEIYQIIHFQYWKTGYIFIPTDNHNNIDVISTLLFLHLSLVALSLIITEWLSISFFLSSTLLPQKSYTFMCSPFIYQCLARAIVYTLKITDDRVTYVIQFHQEARAISKSLPGQNITILYYFPYTIPFSILSMNEQSFPSQGMDKPVAFR